MHESYDDDDDDEYNDDYYDYDYGGDQYDPYKFYFKFDVSGAPLSDWLTNLLGDIYNIQSIPGFPVVSFPVNSWNSNTEKDNTFQYLGSNYQNQPIWKTKYFIVDKINNEYKLHLQNYAKYFVQQPHYYKGMFDILN